MQKVIYRDRRNYDGFLYISYSLYSSIEDFNGCNGAFLEFFAFATSENLDKYRDQLANCRKDK